MSPPPLVGQVALVTGGASGIGRATARVLAAAGAGVAVLDRDASGADAVVRELASAGVETLAIHADLADSSEVPRAVATTLDALGRIDILVNCAGMAGGAGRLLELDEAGWDKTYAVNVKAPALLMKHVARHMVERGGGGRIVNVSSSSAFRSVGSPIAYGSSKAALVQLTRSAAAELGPHDINVNAVAPGVTDTPMVEHAFSDAAAIQAAVHEGPLANLFARVSTPEDVAETILFLCLPGSRQITAQTIHTSAGAVP